MRILLVEDDDMIGESVVAGLECEGHAVDWVRDGNSALLALNTTEFSLVILDLGLPGKDGLQVLKEMRAKRNATPVLVTTARDIGKCSNGAGDRRCYQKLQISSNGY